MVALTLAAAPAVARTVTDAELRALAGRAQTDPAALVDLRTVDRVDGRAVDLGAVIDEGDADVRRARLATLAVAPAGRADSAALRRRAQALSPTPTGQRPTLNQPNAGGGWHVPGTLLWLVAGLVVVGLGAITAGELTQRRATGAKQVAEQQEHADPTGSDALNRDAEDAERRGDRNGALRLRFLAGLAHLRERGRLRDPARLTTSALRTQLASPDFDPLAQRFEAVAYGGQEATVADLTDARERWPRVIGGEG